jgi:hypothetical protein
MEIDSHVGSRDRVDGGPAFLPQSASASSQSGISKPRDHGRRQQLCAHAGHARHHSLKCYRRVTQNTSDRYPQDSSMRWCYPCRQRFKRDKLRERLTVGSPSTPNAESTSDIEFSLIQAHTIDTDVVDESFLDDVAALSLDPLSSTTASTPSTTDRELASTARTSDHPVAHPVDVHSSPTMSESVPLESGSAMLGADNFSASSDCSPAAGSGPTKKKRVACDKATAVNLQQILIKNQRDLAIRAAKQHLQSYRWVAVSADREDRPLIDRWWLKVRQSVDQLRGEIVDDLPGDNYWYNLHIEGRGVASAQRDLSSIKSASSNLVNETLEMVRRRLEELGVQDIRKKHCVSAKLLRAPPGAGRQPLHWDVPQDEPLRGRNRKPIPDTKKAQHCLSVIVHLNSIPKQSTFMPQLTSSALMSRFIHNRRFGCDEQSRSDWKSKLMYQGDMMFFYQDTPHFGPEHPARREPAATSEDATNDWRWVLFFMFSPSDAAQQDEKTVLLKCETVRSYASKTT